MCTVSARGGENSVRDWITVVTQVRYKQFSKRYDVVFIFVSSVESFKFSMLQNVLLKNYS